MTSETLRVAVLVSGRGSNLKALIDAMHGDFPAQVVLVISTRAEATALRHAREAGIPTLVLERRAHATREDYDRALDATLTTHRIGLVVLAGFMHVLGADFVRRHTSHLLNIHPSLLPKFRGLDTHRRALEAGEREHGASVHFVTEDLDAGPIVLQARVPVLPGDDADRLAARVLEREHAILPLAARWFAEGRLRCVDGRAMLDGRTLTEPVEWKDRE